MKNEITTAKGAAVGAAAGARIAGRPLDWAGSFPSIRDPRVPFALILTLYTILGCTALTFSREPTQIILTVLSACIFDMLLCFVLRGQLLVPLSAY
ncbi:MAG: hypothetical protein ACREQW_13450, partial [Candidatus Binatia bacterium]